MGETYGPAPLASLDRVEWRVDGTPSGDAKDGYRARFVPYIDARDVAALLDEWVGPLNWRSRFEEVVITGKAAMWGIISIRDPETGEWVEKRDLGVPSEFEPAKGMVSDAFKRAGCVQWGCGRNVYDLPSIWAPCKVNAKGKAAPNAATLPHIQAELKKQDYEVTGGRATGTDPTADPETGASPLPTGRQATDHVTSEDVAHMKTVLADLTREERERLKTEREGKGLSVDWGKFTVGTLRWILTRAAELIEHRESMAQLTESMEEAGEQAQAAADAAVGPLAAAPARAMARTAEEVAAQLKERAALIRQGGDATVAMLKAEEAVPEVGSIERAAARRQAGGMKLAPKARREAVATYLAKQTEAVQAQVRQWAEESGHTLDDQLQADSVNVVMAAIQSTARAHKLGNAAPPAAPVSAPEDPRVALRRSQWAELEKTAIALGPKDTWPMLIEELAGQGIVPEGTTQVAAVGLAFSQAGEEHDQFLAEMVEQYRTAREQFEERPFTEEGDAPDDNPLDY